MFEDMLLLKLFFKILLKYGIWSRSKRFLINIRKWEDINAANTDSVVINSLGLSWRLPQKEHYVRGDPQVANTSSCVSCQGTHVLVVGVLVYSLDTLECSQSTLALWHKLYAFISRNNWAAATEQQLSNQAFALLQSNPQLKVSMFQFPAQQKTFNSSFLDQSYFGRFFSSSE